MYKRYLTYSVIAFLAVIVLFYTILSFIKTEEIVTKVTNLIKSEYGISLNYHSAELKLFPFPKLIVNGIETNNGINIDKAKISPNVISLFAGELKIKLLEIITLSLNNEQFVKGKFDSSIMINSLSVLPLDSSEIIIDNLTDASYLSLIKNITFSKNHKDLDIKYQLFNDINVKIKSRYDQATAVLKNNINYYNQSLKVNISDVIKDGKIQEGQFKAEIRQLSKAVDSLSPYFDFIINKNIVSEEPFSVVGNIVRDQDKVIYKDIKFAGSNIEGDATLWQDDDLTKNDTLIINFKKLDLFKVTSFNGKNKTSTFSPYKRLDNSKIHLIVSSNQVTIGEDSFSDFKFEGISEGNGFNIIECKGELSSEGKFSILGQVQNNKYRPEFNGVINFIHKDINNLLKKTGFQALITEGSSSLNLLTNAFITPVELELSNFRLQLADVNMRGSIVTKLIGKTPRITGNISFINLNLNTTTASIIKPGYEYFLALAKNMQDSNYLQKYVPIRTLNSVGTLDLNLENFTTGLGNVDRANIILNYEPGMIKVENFSINKDQNYCEGNGQLVANSLRPQLNVNLNRGTIESKELSITNFLTYRESFEKDLDLTKVVLTSKGFLDNFILKGYSFKKIKWELSNLDTLINLGFLQASLFDGNLQLNGNMVLFPLKINLAYGFDSVKVKDLIYYSFNGLLPFNDGLISSAGQIVTNGNSVNELLYNLYIKGKILGKDIKVKNFGLDDFVKEVSEPDYSLKNLEINYSKAAKEGETILKTISSSFALDSGIVKIDDLQFTTLYTSGAAGIAANIYNFDMDLKTAIGFFPLNVNSTLIKGEQPLKLVFNAKGNMFEPSKTLEFESLGEIKKYQNYIDNYLIKNNVQPNPANTSQ